MAIHPLYTSHSLVMLVFLALLACPILSSEHIRGTSITNPNYLFLQLT